MKVSVFSWLLHLGFRRGRFVLRLQGVQRGYLILDGVDAVAPCLVLGVQRVWVVGQRFTCCLCLGILDGLVIVTAKLRLQRVAFAVESIFLLDDFLCHNALILSDTLRLISR